VNTSGDVASEDELEDSEAPADGSSEDRTLDSLSSGDEFVDEREIRRLFDIKEDTQSN
jgi:hypothetical protein